MHTPATHTLALRDYGHSHGSHAHEHFQVLIGLDGVLEIEVEGRGAGIAAGEAQVVAPGDRHDFSAQRHGAVCLVLDTTHAGWARCAERASPDSPQLHTLARYLAQCMKQPQASALALQHGPALLLEAWNPAPASSSDSRRRRIDWPLLADWARARWHQPLAVADLAEVACLSPSQFAQRCRDEQGMGAMQWLRSLRLAHARELRLGGLSVAETARRTGYRSPSALTAALRR
ncbi:AraC family transcriptional regulator [Variovorax sp. NFACC27]|uniref:helix-turn-helix transcriptional regulator n=1 Tax=unclassified Variovorax TaxID=663243 RepID=UPI00089930FC|nr:AraC-type DNA-binding protein [Variovorax sp. NFACC28]SEG95486.1 AraC-type DNA-binding protein [Variovorax sp. NFACC29]SFD77464.1 AraC-type DNA-binding protein [Variovorax sp. NFACC26]SFG92063.1 AraC-type DNA-binding protein [Variovorax sp. NFACC27]